MGGKTHGLKERGVWEAVAKEKGEGEETIAKVMGVKAM